MFSEEDWFRVKTDLHIIGNFDEIGLWRSVLKVWSEFSFLNLLIVLRFCERIFLVLGSVYSLWIKA